jgi:hypothetical protein
VVLAAVLAHDWATTVSLLCLIGILDLIVHQAQKEK